LRPRDVVELIVLAAVWGGSFLFMRIAVPEFGPVAIAALRVAGAALLLLPLLAAHRELPTLRSHWRPIAVLGLVNSALPFLGFAYAAISMDSGVLAIFNSAAPLFSAVVAALWLGDRMTPARIAGLAIGFAGIVGIVAYKSGLHAGGTPLAVVACLVATFCYGLAPSVTKRHLSGASPLAVATGSQLVGAVLLAGPAVLAWPAAPPGTTAWLVVGALSFICTGLGLVMYFRLIAHAGPANAISVTYLIPIFAIAWGSLFLDEKVTWPLLAGCTVVFLGTALATGILGEARARQPA
jgi:drug/metabolite transporter (DMT)-like permease